MTRCAAIGKHVNFLNPVSSMVGTAKSNSCYSLSVLFVPSEEWVFLVFFSFCCCGLHSLLVVSCFYDCTLQKSLTSEEHILSKSNCDGSGLNFSFSSKVGDETRGLIPAMTYLVEDCLPFKLFALQALTYHSQS